MHAQFFETNVPQPDPYKLYFQIAFGIILGLMTAFSIGASCFILKNTAKVTEFGFRPKSILVCAPVFMMSLLGRLALESFSKELSGKMLVLDLTLILINDVSYMFGFIMLIRIVRVHCQLKNKKENTISIVKSMQFAQRTERIYYSNIISLFIIDIGVQLCVGLDIELN